VGWEGVIRNNPKKNGNSWEGLKSDALNRLEWRRSLWSGVGLRRFVAKVNY